MRDELMNPEDVYRYSFSFTQEDVIKFAEISGDYNPLHLDEVYAARTVFRRPIIHGFLGASVFSKVFGTLFPGEGTIYLKQSLDFSQAMYVDTVYEALFTVKEVNRRRHYAIIHTEILDQEKGKRIVSGEAHIIHREKI